MSEEIKVLALQSLEAEAEELDSASTISVERC